MTVWRDDPTAAADRLVDASLSEMALVAGSRLLLVNQFGMLPQRLRGGGFQVSVWNRRSASAYPGQTEPDGGPFDAALIRLPKAKDEGVMTVHQASARVRPGGRLFVYGGNDEGIRTVAKRLADVAGPVETVSTRQHGRVLSFARPADDKLRPQLGDWRHVDANGWVSYPGLFSGGTPDPGTALLLTCLPQLADGLRALDYGCGPGAIAAALRSRSPAAVVDMLDSDAVALLAAAENVPGARTILAHDLGPVRERGYALIASNPPIHDGVKEDHRVLSALIADSVAALMPGGELLLVVQRRVPLAAMLALSFKDVTIAADDGRYIVWRCRKP